MSRRSERVSDLVRHELSTLLQRGLADPRVRLASVSAVEMSPDLRHAVVRVSVLGVDADRQSCLEGLEHARGFLRSRLASRTHLRYTPDLRFELDRGAEHAERITAILEGLDEPSDAAP